MTAVHDRTPAVRPAYRNHVWLRILLTILAGQLGYIAAYASGTGTVLAAAFGAGGLLAAAWLSAISRLWALLALTPLVVAAVTWWSLITPIVAVLALIIGARLLQRPGDSGIGVPDGRRDPR